MNKFWIGNLNLTKKINILGGGISGLLAAYFFYKKGIDFHLYEKKTRLGGKVKSDKTEHGIVEWGPNAIVSSNKVLKLIDELGLKPIYAQKKLKRCIYRDGEVKPFPSVIKTSEKMKVLLSIFKSPPTKNSSLHEFFFPLLGDKLSDEVLSPILRGVYGTSARNIMLDDLNTSQSYFQMLRQKLKGEKLRSLSFQNGTQEIINALCKKLSSHISIGKTIELTENTLICTDPWSASRICKEHKEISNTLQSIKQSPIFSTTFILSKKIQELDDSFGVLFKEEDSPNLMGILANSNIFAERKINSKGFSYTFISQEPLTEEEFHFIQKSLPSFSRQSTLSTHEFKHSYGLPRYDQQRLSAIEKVQTLLQEKNFALWGNYTQEISLRKLIELTSS